MEDGNMKRVAMLMVLSLLVSGTAMAQEVKKSPGGRSYVFLGIGQANAEDTTTHFGGGVEAFLYRGLGVGCELGYLGPIEYMSEGIGLFSVNGIYDFGKEQHSRVSPFITGGYSGAFRQGFANAVNFGGGMHYWFHERAGLRLEIRDHFSPRVWDSHLWEARVGINLR
jgi:hypothetical protein